MSEPRKTHSLEDQIKCLKREMDMRLRVYPGLVGKGKMTAEAARREQELMFDAASTLEGAARFWRFLNNTGGG